MRFGGSQLPLRLRVARTILYCQAAIVILIAGFAIETLVIGGAGMGFPLSGVANAQTLTGGATTALALALIGVAFVLVIVDQQAASRGARARLVLVAAEIAFALYLIGWVANSVGTWIFGPACGVAVLVLHYWPELHGYFFATDALTPAPDAALAPTPAGTEGGPDPLSSSVTPSGAAPASSDAPASGTAPPHGIVPDPDAPARPHL